LVDLSTKLLLVVTDEIHLSLLTGCPSINNILLKQLSTPEQWRLRARLDMKALSIITSV
jgi:hypothetical protein